MQSPVQAGTVLAGKYCVERVLGEGGMGVVVEATQLGLDRRVALKFLRSDEGPAREEALARFEREARAIARLRGDHVAQVYDVGRLDDDTPYIVMECLRGRDLQSELRARGPMPIGEAVALVLQACEAMAEAHAIGIVHRDLKPANLFLTQRPDGRPLIKVLDFGISKLTSDDQALTTTQGAIGSPLYMSPEQIASTKHVDHRTDVWSLGAILYELVAGVPPFTASSTPGVYVEIVTSPPAPLPPGIPAGFEQLLQRCLQKKPEDRFATVGDLAAALVAFAPAGARVNAAAALRIIGASPLAHAGLPSSLEAASPRPAASSGVSIQLGSAATQLAAPTFQVPSAARRSSPEPVSSGVQPPATADPTRISGEPARSGPPIAGERSDTTLASAVSSSSRRRGPEAARAAPRRGWLVALGAAALGLAGVTALLVAGWPREEPPSVPSPAPAAAPTGGLAGGGLSTAAASAPAVTIATAPSAETSAAPTAPASGVPTRSAQPGAAPREAPPAARAGSPTPTTPTAKASPDDLLRHRK